MHLFSKLTCVEKTRSKQHIKWETEYEYEKFLDKNHFWWLFLETLYPYKRLFDAARESGMVAEQNRLKVGCQYHGKDEAGDPRPSCNLPGKLRIERAGRDHLTCTLRLTKRPATGAVST